MTDTEKALLEQVKSLTQERDQWAAKYHQSSAAYDLLVEQIKAYQRHRFGQRSERFEDADHPQKWIFDSIAAEQGQEAEPSDDNVVPFAKPRRKQKRAVRFPNSVPRRTVIIPLDEALKQCGCGREKSVINYATHERLFYRPPVFEVIIEKREIAACRQGCKGEVVTSPLPAHVLPKSKLSESMVAHVIVSKLDDRQPFYHLEKQLKHRAGITLSRQTMARAAIECAAALQPIVNLMKDRVIDYDVAALDATGLQVLNEPGRSPAISSSVYCMRGGPPDESVVLYDYNAEAHKQFVHDWFSDFTGTLHCDADPLFEQLFERKTVIPSHCNAHARRYFEPIAKATRSDGLAKQAMRFYQRLYKVERHAKNENMTAEQRCAVRLQYSKPILDEYKQWLDEHYDTLLPKSPLGKAFTYVLSRWQGFCQFLDDGRLEIDNNLTEQQIKPFVIARKNFLFCNSVNGARALCVHFSLLRTAKRHGLEPFRYFEAILTAAPHCQTVDDYEALLPWNITMTADHQTIKAA